MFSKNTNGIVAADLNMAPVLQNLDRPLAHAFYGTTQPSPELEKERSVEYPNISIQLDFG